MATKDKQFKIYGPTHFRYTWDKYLEICKRDGTNASREIRAFVEGEVKKRDPGNPQRTLGVFVEGHVEHSAARRSDLVKEFLRLAELREGEILYREILEAYKSWNVPGWKRVAMSKSMATDLKNLKVTIVY